MGVLAKKTRSAEENIRVRAGSAGLGLVGGGGGGGLCGGGGGGVGGGCFQLSIVELCEHWGNEVSLEGGGRSGMEKVRKSTEYLHVGGLGGMLTCRSRSPSLYEKKLSGKIRH